MEKLDYDEIAADIGFKYRGISFQSEYYVRRLSDDFQTTDAPLPAAAVEPILDHGFRVQGMHVVVPRLVGVYLTYGYVFDEFDRRPWEASGGVSYNPSTTRSWRLNLRINRVERSPTSSSFGFYTAGQTGTTFSIGTDILL